MSLVLRSKNSGSVSVGQSLPNEQGIVKNAGRKDAGDQIKRIIENAGSNVIQLTDFTHHKSLYINAPKMAKIGRYV